MTDSFDNIKQVKINAPNTESNAWSTEKVDEWIYQEQMGLEHPHGSPFSYGAIGFRKGNIVFKYTEDEINEIRKCKKDINYFADKYAFAMTDDGVAKINLYGFQRDILKNLQDHRFSIICASRQIGKCSQGSTLINTQHGNTAFYEIYFNELKKIRELNVYEKLKSFLYRTISKLNV